MIRLINTTDDEYVSLLELRNNVLRKPLGLDISNDDLSDESQCQHIAYYTDEARLVACVKIRKVENTLFQISQMAVLPDYQNQGIGSKLLREAESLIRDQGGSAISIESRKQAIPFYSGNGYSISGNIYNKVGIPHRRMKKLL